MKSFRDIASVFLTLVALVSAILVSGCSQSPTKKSGKSTEKPKHESDLAYVTLSKKAHQALHIETAPIRMEMVHEHLRLTGWIMAPQGSEVTLTAPVAGYVQQAGTENHTPVEGQTVAKNQELFQIEPVLSPVEKLQVATLKRGVGSELKKAKTSMQVAQKEVDRMAELHKKGLRSQQDLEKAQERFKHAQEDLKAAQDKQKLFSQEPVPIRAPRAGTVLTLSVSPGQYVPTSAPLITVADLSRLWVRVPVPEYDLPAVNPKQAARIAFAEKNVLGKEGNAPGNTSFVAKPVTLVPKVDTTRHTVDLIYELSPEVVAQNTFVKDQMVNVSIPLGRKSKQSIVPYSAVVYDGQGGTWIYLDRTKKDSSYYQYERRRVQLGPRVDDGVVIQRIAGAAGTVESQPSAESGDRVVVSGAGVLLSREFHSTPVTH